MACCGKSEIDSNDVKTNNDFNRHSYKANKQDLIRLVVKIQAFYRGYRTRKLIEMHLGELRQQQFSHMNQEGNEYSMGNGNYEN
mmetsp:Transcript_14778/g.10682  ORF Transcript_14778/g.10682 Transcript_14778/m.10682 type:complete len:84 (+) Transcript_14778:29-280(+)